MLDPKDCLVRCVWQTIKLEIYLHVYHSILNELKNKKRKNMFSQNFCVFSITEQNDVECSNLNFQQS